MSTLLLGNIICLIGSILMAAIGLIKNKDKILIWQCVQCGVLSVGNLVLGGISGALVDFVTIARNVVALKWDITAPVKVIFILIQIVLTAIFNNMGFIGWLPVSAACVFTWCVDTKNPIVLKVLIIFAQTMWAIYDLSINNYSTLAFDIAAVVTNVIGIVAICRGREKQPAAAGTAHEPEQASGAGSTQN